jgi:hypothetical protein
MISRVRVIVIQQYFNYIMVVSFIGGVNRSALRKSLNNSVAMIVW